MKNRYFPVNFDAGEGVRGCLSRELSNVLFDKQTYIGTMRPTFSLSGDAMGSGVVT